MSAKLIVLLVCAIVHLSVGGIVQQTSSKNFVAQLFSQIAKGNIDENIVISPLSIQSALVVAYLTSDGKTAEELVRALNLPYDDKSKNGQYFSNLLGLTVGNVDILTVDNGIFLNPEYTLRPSFNQLAQKYRTSAQNVNFAQSEEATKIINSWANQKTQHKIQNVLDQELVNGNTPAIIASVAAFRGNWEKPFLRSVPSKRPFYISQSNVLNVETMSVVDRFLYAELPELDAVAIQLPYKRSDLSLVVLLPNQVDGLANLEQKINLINLENVQTRFSYEVVSVTLPTFRVRYAIQLKQALQALGIRSIFGNSAELNGIIQSGPPIQISEVLQEVEIVVDEGINESPVSPDLRTSLPTLEGPRRSFNADHPFMFAIRSKNGVYFIGHFVQP